jgi:transcriptional regulator with XRE-family HTH domain
MADFDDLYAEVGRRLRQARVTKGLSQERLAQQLGISRASVVNIEAGRQRAPLHLLWQLSEALGTDLSLLIPRREELSPTAKESTLDPVMVKQIREAANNDPDAVKILTRLASKLKATIEIDSPVRKADDQRKARRKS